MSLTQTLVWTALPRGRAGTTLRLSVLVAPRLAFDGAGPHSLMEWYDFRAGDGSWPTLVNGGWGYPPKDPMGFTVVAKDASGKTHEYAGARVARTSADASKPLYSLLFPTSTVVGTWVDEDLSKKVIRSFPMAALASVLDSVQAALPRAGRPTRTQVVGYPKGSGILDGFSISPQERASLERSVANALVEAKATVPPDTSTAAGVRKALVQLESFLKPPVVLAGDADPLVWTPPEFHELYSLYSSHPNLLRLLGFLIDLTVDTSADQLPAGDVDLRVSASYSGTMMPGITKSSRNPTTRCVLSATDLRLARRGGTLTSGLLVNVDGWKTITSEVESESIALLATATNVERSREGGLDSHDTPDRVGVPARRSAGIAVVRPAIAPAFRAELADMWSAQEAVTNDTGPVLFAEDLVVGYRLDVRKTGGQWRSLHLRAGTLTPVTPTAGLDNVALEADEGWLETAATSGASSDELRVTEAVARWTGWSLSIPRPGQFLDDSDELTPSGAGSASGVYATMRYAAPATGANLLPLRFGQAYEARLRAVDAAGGGPAASIVDASSKLAVPYRRHEPVPSPDLFVSGTATWGESPDVVVVRSEGAGAAVPAKAAASSRVIAPPRGSQWLAEQHGRFDSGGLPSAGFYDAIAARESASYAGKAGTVPYLPDPMAAGILVRGGPQPANAFDGTAVRLFGGSWPERTALRLVVTPTTAPDTTTGSGVVDVGIAPGRVARLRLSCSVNSADLPLFDLWGRVGKAADAGAASSGAWWQLTPDRTVTVVHATRRPVSAPRFAPADTWTVSRPAGEPAVTLNGFVRLDLPSTAQVSLTGSVVSGVDRGPGAAAPAFATTSTGVVGTTDVPEPAIGSAESKVSVLLRVPLPDTKRRRITVSAVATSRFAEYFRTSRSTVIGNASVVIAGAAAVPVVPGSVRVQWTVGGSTIDAVDGRDFTVDAAAGTLQRRGGSAIPNTSVTVSWIAAPITLASGATATLGERTKSLTLPASKRPEAPEVASVLPTLAWNSPARPTAIAPTVTSRRTGSGLRVYLERPWWTSGIGEELAIVLRPAGAPSVSPINDLATRWGPDPATITTGALPVTWPGIGSFPNRSADATGVQIAEVSGTTVDLARYAVGAEAADGSPIGYDADRDLWFADIVADQGSAYRPFMRLALARYQPEAAAGIRLSPITILDIVQLEPERIATVEVPWLPNQVSVNARVTLTGPSYQRNEAGSGPGVAYLMLESSSPADPDGTGIGWSQVGNRVTLEATYDDATGTGRWVGRIPVPQSRAAGRYRLVVEQYERWRTDGRAPGGVATVGTRLVHQDIIRL